MRLWVWIALGALVVLVIVEQLRIFKVNREFRKKDEIFQAVTENAADMIALVDDKGRRLYNSPAYKRVLGYSPSELSETSSFEQIHPDDRMRVLEAAREARESGVGRQLEYRIKHKDGSWRVLESVASTIRDAKGDVAKLVIVNRDITERKRAEQQLEYKLFDDLLTGLPNRRMFMDRLQSDFGRVRRETGRSYALLLANVDHFKVFNEAMGTKAGDHILTEIARRLSVNCGRMMRPRGIAPQPATRRCSAWEPMNSRSCWKPWAIRATRCALPAGCRKRSLRPSRSNRARCVHRRAWALRLPRSRTRARKMY
jgi:PAS domain S-box-containing protein